MLVELRGCAEKERNRRKKLTEYKNLKNKLFFEPSIDKERRKVFSLFTKEVFKSATLIVHQRKFFN